MPTIIRVCYKNTVYVIDLWITDAVCDVKSWMHFAIENIAASSCVIAVAIAMGTEITVLEWMGNINVTHRMTVAYQSLALHAIHVFTQLLIVAIKSQLLFKAPVFLLIFNNDKNIVPEILRKF